MHIEVEDTGSGIDPAAHEKMKSNMKHADIDMLKTGGRVGVINACLRIKMVTESKACLLYTSPTTSEGGKVKNNLEAVKKRWLPQVIMADDFGAAWDQYCLLYTSRCV